MKLPDAVALALLPLHVIVRDFPETLAVFHRFGIDLPLRGSESLAAVTGAEAASIYDELRAATAWRDGARPGRCERAAAQAASRQARAIAAETVSGAQPGSPPSTSPWPTAPCRSSHCSPTLERPTAMPPR